MKAPIKRKTTLIPNQRSSSEPKKAPTAVVTTSSIARPKAQPKPVNKEGFLSGSLGIGIMWRYSGAKRLPWSPGRKRPAPRDLAHSITSFTKRASEGYHEDRLSSFGKAV